MTPTNSRDSGETGNLDLAFKTLSNAVRRRILTALWDDNPRTVGEFETAAFSAPGTDRESNRIELYHIHLPQLDTAGFIDWDQETGQVTQGENFEEIRAILEWLSDHAETRPQSDLDR